MQEALREVWFLVETDTIVFGVHPKDWCSGACVVHNPSDHRMREFPLHFDTVKKSFYRACPHGLLHQDWDERYYWIRQLETARDKKASALAMGKLAEWPCPSCNCNCCLDHF
jgi:hypothetical protein